MRTWMLVTVVAALATATALADDDGKKKKPTVGDTAPDFRLNDHTGKAYRLSEAGEGRWIILAFFPKADTPG